MLNSLIFTSLCLENWNTFNVTTKSVTELRGNLFLTFKPCFGDLITKPGHLEVMNPFFQLCIAINVQKLTQS